MKNSLDGINIRLKVVEITCEIYEKIKRNCSISRTERVKVLKKNKYKISK